MGKGYKFGYSPCPECGKLVADNWYIRHLRMYHPVRVYVSPAEVPAGGSVRLVGVLSDQTDLVDWALFRKLAGVKA